MTQTVGMLGLGIMGGAMARNLVAGGFEVIGYDPVPQATTDARSAGVEIAANGLAVAQRAQLLITSLPSAKAAIETAEAIAAAGLPRRIVAETSTLSLEDKQAFHDILAAAGHVALDCPLSGTGAQAAVKDLVIFASGDASAIAELTPVFMGLGRKVQNLGAFGNGTRMKYVANLLVAINNVATAEAMVLGMKAGLDPHQIIETVSAGAGNSRVFELRAPLMADNSYLPATMRVRTWKKDMTVIGEFASSLDCPTPLFSATNLFYDTALNMGLAESDTAAVCAVYEKLAGLSRGGGKSGA